MKYIPRGHACCEDGKRGRRGWAWGGGGKEREIHKAGMRNIQQGYIPVTILMFTSCF